MIDLLKGHPNPKELPHDSVRTACTALASRAQAGALDLPLGYGPEAGSARYLSALAAYLTAMEPAVPVQPGWLFATGGCSHGLELLVATLCAANDVIVCEEATYFLSGQIFRDHRLRVVVLPADTFGLSTDALTAAIERDGLRPRLVYSVATHANPTGVTLACHRRVALDLLARAHGFWVVADEAYHLLTFDCAEEHGERPMRMATYDAAYTASAQPAPAERDEEWAAVRDAGGLVSVGTWAKILAPALRVGWIEARPALIRLLSRRGYVYSGGGPVGLSAELVAEAVLSGDALRHVERIRGAYATRCAALAEALRGADVGFTFTQPSGGYFIWVRLPDWAPAASALAPIAREAGVAFLPGRSCSALEDVPDEAGRMLDRHVRLCFALHDAPELAEGVRRLARAMVEARP
jgi:DNA-binding transcriptional MocR family regulator